MVVQIFYTKNSENERQAADLAGQLAQTQVQVKLVEADSVEGSSLCELYDVTSRPAVVLARDDGSVVERWQNGWPLVSDISYLAHR